MCYVLKCNKCKLFTWAGCGNHIDNIKKQVLEKDRCKCKQWVKFQK